MSKRAFEKIKAGLDSAKAYLDGTADNRKYRRVHVPDRIDVRKIRTRLGLSQEAFGQFAPGALLEWSVATLPRQVALWIESYGSKILLTDFPGSKLYLILERELSDGHEVSRTIRRRIFPLHNPTRVAAAPAGSVVQRLTAALHQWRYFFFRLRFHLTQSSRYLLEDRRWKRQLKHLCAQRLHRHADCTAHASD